MWLSIWDIKWDDVSNMEKFSKIDILMAIYKPNLKWLEEQLISLNNQTYENLNLIVWNDCPDDNFNYDEFFNKYITEFKFKIYKGKINLGSNKAFEELTKLSKSEYVAYCDQDDIWLPEKLSRLVLKIQETNADLICSDMFVIDKNSKVVADKITQVRPHQIFYKGSNFFEYLFSKNFVTGCTTLVRTKFAKSVLPFPDEYVHDWWLGICAARNNKLEIVEESLIMYRIHGTNQTGILSGIVTKEDYYNKKIKMDMQRSLVLTEKFLKNNNVNQFKKYTEYRINYYKKQNLKNFYKLFNLRKFNISMTYFELILPLLPECIFELIIKQIKKGKI